MRKTLCCVVVVVLALIPLGVAAHFCSNIFRAHAKIVVKPEKTSVAVGSTPTALKVYLQNNFPFKIRWVEMRGTATGYTVNVTPGPIDIFPGQQVGFDFTISGPAATIPVTTLNLQVRFRDDRFNSFPPNGVSGWKDLNYYVVNQNPTQSALVNAYPQEQRDSNSMIAAALADKYPTGTFSSSPPTFGRTGIQQLIKMFGYRFCWTSDFQWRCGAQDCPTPCAEGAPWAADAQFANNCMRAGAELAVRKSVLGSELAAAQAGAINAMKAGGSPTFKCLAAIVGGYLYQGAPSTAFTAALTSTTNAVPQICQNAGMRVLDGSNASTCASGQPHEQAACAGAEGLRGNDVPVNTILKQNALDNCTPSCTFASETPGLFHAYMMYIVANHRRSTVGYVSFYPDSGTAGCDVAGDCDDGNVCTTDACSGGSCTHAPVAGCCTQSTQCNDSNPCTTDTCNTTTHTCQTAPVAGCCTQSSQCADTDPCTADTCNTTSHACQHSPVTGCCSSNTQCDDGSSCTTDTCNTTTHVCAHAPVPGCCTTNTQCADNDPCTTDTCNTSNGTCSNQKQASCCAYDTDCDDRDACTVDKCDTTSHACTHTPSCTGDLGPGSDRSGAGEAGGPAADFRGEATGGGGPGALSGGCGCAISSPAHAAGALVLLLLLAVAGIVLRRR